MFDDNNLWLQKFHDDVGDHRPTFLKDQVSSVLNLHTTNY